MILYFAGSKHTKEFLTALNKQPLLYSYYEIQKDDFADILKKVSFNKLFLDSGAYSALTQNAAIDIDKYVEFIKKNKERLTCYANLDVIGDPEATQRNQEYLEQQGLKPLPTFHFNSDIKYLKGLLEKYDYIALGGLVPYVTKRKILERWLDYCFSYILPHIPKVKVHGFGLSSLWAWKKYPFYSADSTSWLQPGRYGRVTTLKNGIAGAYDKKSSNVLAYQLSQPQGYVSPVVEQARVYLKMAHDVTGLWQHRLGSKYYEIE